MGYLGSAHMKNILMSANFPHFVIIENIDLIFGPECDEYIRIWGCSHITSAAGAGGGGQANADDC